jgi:uncharacterized protein YkwD
MAQQKLLDYVRIVGDVHIGAKHRGRAHTLLKVCRQLASVVQDLPQYVIREVQDDKCEIVAEKRGAFSVATIFVPTFEVTKRKEEAPGLTGSLILVAGTEIIGYHVAQISFDGELLRELEFEKATDLFQALPRSSISRPIYASKAILDPEDASVIGVNTLSEATWEPACEITAPHCPLAPGSGTIQCIDATPTTREVEGEPRQAAVFRFHRRQYCDRRQGSSAYFVDKRDYIQLTENAGWKGNIGPALFIPLDGGDPASFYDDALSISCLVFEKRFYCTASWEDDGERDWDDILSGDQIYFQLLIAPSGLMKLDPGYSTIETGDYLDGNFKFREDTGEPWFVTWDDPLLALFLRQDLRSSVYAWNKPLPGFGARVFNTPLRVGYLESGAPDFNTNSPVHELFFAAEYLNVAVQVYGMSFMEGTFDKMGTVGTYTLTDTRHRTLTSAASLYDKQTLASASERNEKLRAAVEAFFFSVRAKQLAAEVEINENMSLAGNLYAYISDGTSSGPDPMLGVLSEINSIRIFQSLPKLSLDVDLEFAAQMHAIDCAKNSLESHTGSDGSSPADRMLRTSYHRRFSLICEVGENVAFGQTSAREAVQAWITSPPHWANIINPDWTDTGIAVWPDEEGRLYWVQVFGRRDL